MTTYYVSEIGNDSNSGLTEKTAFKSLGRASWSLQAGDTIYVMNGTYTNQNIWIFNKNGSPEKWTTVKAYPGHTPKLKTTGSGILIFSSSYIRLEGLYIEGNRENVTLEYALQQKDNLTNPLTNANGIEVKDWKDDKGVGGTPSHHVVISGNTVRNFPGGGIAFINTDYITVEKNIVSGNAWYSPWGCQGISALRSFNYDNNTTTARMIIRDNIVYDNQSLVPWHEAGKITEGHGIMLDTFGVTQKNTTGNQDIPAFDYSGKALISNNLVYNCGGCGINVFKAWNVDIVNNTTYQNARILTDSVEIGAGFSKNVKVYNNILCPRTDRKANDFYIGINISFDNNLIYGGLGFTPRSNDAATGQKNILDKDPLFVDAANKNFKLKPETPAIRTEIKQEKKLVDEKQIVKEEKVFLTKDDLLTLFQKLNSTVFIDNPVDIKFIVEVEKTVQVEKLIDTSVKYELGYTGK